MRPVASLQDLSRERDRTLDGLPADLLSSEWRLGIYGMGFFGEWAMRWLRQNHVEPIACFDSSKERQGSVFSGLRIKAPDEIEGLGLDLVLITARHAVSAVAKTLNKYQVKWRSLDGYFVARNFSSFQEIHDHVLVDDRSRETLRAVMMTMLTGDRIYLHDVLEGSQYFCLPIFGGSEKESYVDAGAYVGDSVERFIWSNNGVFSKIHAFEPSERQFAALEKRCERLTIEWALDKGAIELHRAGLSDVASRMAAATASGQLQSVALAENEHGSVATVSLDTCLDGERVTFIKADVEGMEMALLKGAADTIVRWTPKLAICVYHYPSDILDIVAYIRTLVPEYNMAIRHHSPQLMETVLYCWAD